MWIYCSSAVVIVVALDVLDVRGLERGWDCCGSTVALLLLLLLHWMCWMHERPEEGLWLLWIYCSSAVVIVVALDVLDSRGLKRGWDCCGSTVALLFF